MIDFPIIELLSDEECVKWLEAFLRPEGLICPHCGSAERRLIREQGNFPAYRCLSCDGYYTLLSDTIFEKTHQRPATLVLLLRGIAKGESSARLSRELGIGRKRVMQLRHAIQNNLNETLPTAVMDGQTFEADEVYQNAGKKGKPHLDPDDPPRCRANKAKGRGTYDNDRPPIIGVVCRETGEYRYWVVEHADKATCREKDYLTQYVATFETLLNAKAISPAVVQRMCFGNRRAMHAEC